MPKAFVSSTFADLREHRSHVINDLGRANIDVDPMEQWTAASDAPKTLSQGRLDGCDLCILLVARRRGHVPDGETLSITQLEVREAEARGIDVLVFVLADDSLWHTNWDELEKDAELVRWRKDLAEHRTVEFFDHNPSSVAVLPAVWRWREKHNAAAAPQATSAPAAAKGAFVGREHALTALRQMVSGEAADRQRPIVLVGMGGLGKTALAHELIRQTSEQFDGRELLLSRSAGSHPRPARDQFSLWAKEMGLKEEVEYTPEQMRREFADRRGPTICLLDDAAEDDAAELKLILRALPGDWTRLITTRQKSLCVALDEVVEYPVRPLSNADASALIGLRLHAKFDAAVDDGAMGVDAAIAQHREVLEEFIVRVRGLPLALRLGIGACDSLAEIPTIVGQLIASLDAGISSFAAGALRATGSDNSSLAASLTISLRDLERIDAELGLDSADRFRALGVLPDGSTYDRHLLLQLGSDAPGGDDALRVLVDHSMIDKDATTGRYSIHPVLRAFAYETLASGREQLAAARRRYQRIVVERAQRAYADAPERWTAPDDLRPHLARVMPDLRDAIAQRATVAFNALAAPEVDDGAVAQAGDELHAEDVALGADLAKACRRAVRRRPWGPIGTDLLQLGLVCARVQGDAARQASYLSRLGARHSTRDSDRAISYFEAAVRLARTHDAERLGTILSFYAEHRRTVEDSELALELGKEALAIHESHGDDKWAARTHLVLGEVYWRLSLLDDATEHYAKARALLEQLNDQQAVADLLNKLASVEFNRGGRFEQAIALFEQALELHEALQDRVMQAEDHNDLGACYRYLRRYDEALQKFEQALELNTEIGNYRLQAINICNIAGTLYAQGQYDLAERRAVAGRELGEKVDAPVPQLWGRVWEGLAWQGMDEPGKAEARLRAAVDFGRSFTNPRDLAGALARLGLLLADELERPSEALPLLDEAIDLLTRYRLVTAFSNITLIEIWERRDAVARRQATS